MLRNSFFKLLKNLDSQNDSNQEKSEADRETMVRKLRQARTNDPLYKKHDDYLRGSDPMAAKLEDRSPKDAMARWRLGRYSPSHQDPHAYSAVDPLSSHHNAKSLSPAAEFDSSGSLISGHLKDEILHRYVSAAEEQIAKRDDLSLFYDHEAAQIADEIESTDELKLFNRAEEFGEAKETERFAEFESFSEAEAAEDDTSSMDYPGLEQLIDQFEDELTNFEESMKPRIDIEALFKTDEVSKFAHYGIQPAQELQTQPQELDWVPPQIELTGWQGLVSRRRRLVEQAISMNTHLSFQSLTETADFEPYVVPEGECLLPWGNEYLADDRDTAFSNPREGKLSIQIDQSGAVNCELGLPDTKIVDTASAKLPDEFVDDLDYIRYIFSSRAETSVLERISRADTTPSFVLAQLAFYPEVDVRCAVSQNRNTPTEALWFLCQDESETIRYLLAANANIPMPVLEVLTKDVNEYIAIRAQKTLHTLRTKVVTATFGQNIIRRRRAGS